MSLTDAEFRVLNAFLDHPQQLLTRDQLIDMTKGSEAPVYDRSVDVIVSRLRKKLGRDAPIRTALWKLHVHAADQRMMRD